MLKLFKGKTETETGIPEAPAPLPHPFQRALIAVMEEMERELTKDVDKKPAKGSGEKPLPRALALSALAAMPIGRTWLAKLTPEQCDKFVAMLNTYNARLCHECGIEPERITG